MRKDTVIIIRTEQEFKKDLKKISLSRGQTMSEVLRYLVSRELLVSDQALTKHSVTTKKELNAGQPA
jgi:mRNA-degrading endonuclease YafQ of YafQ-DinJ toxin-antitoxin module